MSELSYERALDILAGTPPVLGAIVVNMPKKASDERPSAAAWSPREVLGHLLYTETSTMAPRIKRAALGDASLLEVPSMPAPGDPRQMSNDWADARAENLEWLRQLRPEQRTMPVQHPRFGKVTIETYVAEWAYHDLDHLRQILSVLAADLYPYIGPFQELYTAPS